nr:MAG TPA: hypothetical protein [Caudoviricetes sp.]
MWQKRPSRYIHLSTIISISGFHFHCNTFLYIYSISLHIII